MHPKPIHENKMDPPISPMKCKSFLGTRTSSRSQREDKKNDKIVGLRSITDVESAPQEILLKYPVIENKVFRDDP